MQNIRFLFFSWIYLQVYLSNQNRCCACAFQANYKCNTSNVPLLKTKRVDNVKKLGVITQLSGHQRGGAVNNTGADGDRPWLTALTSPTKIASTIRNEFQVRLAADPDFVKKSIVEIFLAAGSQLTAEVGRRGMSRMLPEIDFVIAGLFTAIAGKYYAMWRVARTVSDDRDNQRNGERKSSSNKSRVAQTTSSWRSNVPNNAFQTTLLDGETRPTMIQRIYAFIIPMPSLFQAGFIASAFGYGFTALLIALRTLLVPAYEAATVNMNILHACLYTGGFMAIVSNVRYQVLQGVIEPKIIDKLFAKTPNLRASTIFLVRLGNGLLGSYLAISGMKIMGLQKLK